MGDLKVLTCRTPSWTLVANRPKRPEGERIGRLPCITLALGDVCLGLQASGLAGDTSWLESVGGRLGGCRPVTIRLC